MTNIPFLKIEMTTNTGNRLTLVNTEKVRYYGYLTFPVFELYYSEYSNNVDDECMTLGIEYYKVEDIQIAFNAFVERYESGNLSKLSATYPGLCLKELLDKEEYFQDTCSINIKIS